MQKHAILLLVALLAACAGTTPAPTGAKGQTFQQFYAKLRAEAAAKGFNPATLDAAFSGTVAPVNAVLKSEKAQPELVRTFSSYTGPMLSRQRVAQGVMHMQAHADELRVIRTRTGVPAGTVVALWGIETNFGKSQGEHPVIPALVTLAWQSPRGSYFRNEVYDALRVVNKTGIKPAELKGSWAGAMGQCQFMPSSYMAYAADGDGDGKADIWNNEADVFASAANYLRSKGWRAGTPWRLAARGVNVGGLKLNERGLSEALPLADWQARGFTSKQKLPFSTTEKFRYYKPEAEGPAFLLGPNFDAILKWNNSSYFAYSVLALADILEQESR
jgi:membrane-bound lytic murein transglycosylase B